MRSSALLAAAAAALVLTSGCDAIDDAFDSANEASKQPKPHRYTAGQLERALPRNAKQLHGVKVSEQESCRDIDGRCKGTLYGGLASIVAADNSSMGLHVVLDAKGSVWQKSRRKCPQGKFQQLDGAWTSSTSYQPDVRGTSKRTPYKVGQWTGSVCRQKLRYYQPGEKEVTDRDSLKFVQLTNTNHGLLVLAKSVKEAKAYANEYLERLDAAAGR